MSQFDLEKTIWVDADFARMGWHDASIWAMAANPAAFEFLVDLDYIFQWVQPAPGETYFKFWVAPVTMVFENAADVKVAVESAQGSLEVADFYRVPLDPLPGARVPRYSYRFDCQEGLISLEASSYKMYVRRPPTLLTAQSLELDQRGGFDFSKGHSDS